MKSKLSAIESPEGLIGTQQISADLNFNGLKQKITQLQLNVYKFQRSTESDFETNPITLISSMAKVSTLPGRSFANPNAAEPENQTKICDFQILFVHLFSR